MTAAEHTARWKQRHRLAAIAHRRVRRAVLSGRLVREACQHMIAIAGKPYLQMCRCGAHDTQAHHDDYNEPLKVRWLCREHHRAADAARRLWEAPMRPERPVDILGALQRLIAELKEG